MRAIGSPEFTYDLTVSIITGIVVSLLNLLVLKKLVQKKYYRRFFGWLVILGILVAALVWLTNPQKIQHLISTVFRHSARN